MGYELRTGGLESLKDLAKEVYSFGPGHGSNAKYSRDDTLRQLIAKNRAVRRAELRKLVPLSDVTIHELERPGEISKALLPNTQMRRLAAQGRARMDRGASAYY
tara:strand:+ start:361 stop:672 length:312 start_codon:yes stop_codon:yes gene_type:complete